ncbi:hypothetical protein DA798_10075, partial [Lactobacillus sp. PFC-70]
DVYRRQHGRLGGLFRSGMASALPDDQTGLERCGHHFEQKSGLEAGPFPASRPLFGSKWRPLRSSPSWPPGKADD